MKDLKRFLMIMILACFVFTISSCGENKKAKNAKTEQAEDESKQGKEYTSAYICPMHCDGSGSDKPGKCPVCEMDYKKNDKSKVEDHSGHNH